MEIKRGDTVTVRTAFGDRLERVALSTVEMGRDFPVVWVCSPTEWERRDEAVGGPEGLPWPAEDVELAEAPAEAEV